MSIESELLEVDVTAKRKLGMWRILSVPMVLINMLVMFANASSGGASTAYEQGRVAGSLLAPLILPILVIAFFSISNRFRNPASRWKIFFWTSLIIFIPQFSNLVSKAADAAN